MKILLAAIDGSAEATKVMSDVRAPYVLASFFYSGWMHNQLERPDWFSALKTARFRMLDSGAFTLQTTAISMAGTKGNAKALGVDYDLMLDKYIKWTQSVRRFNLFDVWVEMDISVVTGYDWVHAQRHKLIAAGLGKGLVNVWHANADWDYWLYLLREAQKPGRSRYVAIEGNALDRPEMDYAKFLHVAYRAGVRVHGFKMTKLNCLKKYPFYSVDSSSWIASVVYGTTTTAHRSGGVSSKGKRLRVAEPGATPVWKGSTPLRMYRKQRIAMLESSARAWVQASHDLDQYWKRRGVDWDIVEGMNR